MTRTTKIVGMILSLSLVCAACSDDDGQQDNNNNVNENQNDNQNQNQNNNNVVLNPYTGPLSNLDGYYQLTEVDVREGPSTIPLTRTKTLVTLGGDSYDTMVRGYGDVTASSASAGDFDLRWAIVTDDIMSGETAYRVDRFDDSVTWESADGKLVMTTGADTMVYICEFDAGVLTLHYDGDDNRNTTMDPTPPARVMLTQITRPTSPVAGSWRMVYSYTQFGIHEVEEIDACTEGRPDGSTVGSYGKIDYQYTWTDEGWYEAHKVVAAHDASDCSDSALWSTVVDEIGIHDVDAGNTQITTWYASTIEEEGHQLMIGLTQSYSEDATSLHLNLVNYDSNFITGEYPDILVMVPVN